VGATIFSLGHLGRVTRTDESAALCKAKLMGLREQATSHQRGYGTTRAGNSHRTEAISFSRMNSDQAGRLSPLAGREGAFRRAGGSRSLRTPPQRGRHASVCVCVLVRTCIVRRLRDGLHRE